MESCGLELKGAHLLGSLILASDLYASYCVAVCCVVWRSATDAYIIGAEEKTDYVYYIIIQTYDVTPHHTLQHTATLLQHSATHHTLFGDAL